MRRPLHFGAIRREILRGSDSKAIQRVARTQGMRVLREDGARQVIAGVTSIDEVLAATQAGMHPLRLPEAFATPLVNVAGQGFSGVLPTPFVDGVVAVKVLSPAAMPSAVSPKVGSMPDSHTRSRPSRP